MLMWDGVVGLGPQPPAAVCAHFRVCVEVKPIYLEVLHRFLFLRDLITAFHSEQKI